MNSFNTYGNKFQGKRAEKLKTLLTTFKTTNNSLMVTSIGAKFEKDGHKYEYKMIFDPDKTTEELIDLETGKVVVKNDFKTQSYDTTEYHLAQTPDGSICATNSVNFLQLIPIKTSSECCVMLFDKENMSITPYVL